MALPEPTAEQAGVVKESNEPRQSHVLLALIRKPQRQCQRSPEVTVWGAGTPRRELLYSDDLAQACVMLLNLPDDLYGTLLRTDEPPLINVGTGEDLSIRELADTVFHV